MTVHAPLRRPLAQQTDPTTLACTCSPLWGSGAAGGIETLDLSVPPLEILHSSLFEHYLGNPNGFRLIIYAVDGRTVGNSASGQRWAAFHQAFILVPPPFPSPTNRPRYLLPWLVVCVQGFLATTRGHCQANWLQKLRRGGSRSVRVWHSLIEAKLRPSCMMLSAQLQRIGTSWCRTAKGYAPQSLSAARMYILQLPSHSEVENL